MARDCYSILAESLQWCEGKIQYPGIRNRVWYIPRTHLVNKPVYTTDDTNSQTISFAYLRGKFETKEGETWLYIDIIPEKSQATSEPQGEYPSQTSLDKLVMFYPDTSDLGSRAGIFMHNRDNVYIFQDINGNARVIGLEDQWPTKAEVSMDIGQGPTGSAGTTITVSGTSRIPFPIYQGTIESDEGEIDFNTRKPGN